MMACAQAAASGPPDYGEYRRRLRVIIRRRLLVWGVIVAGFSWAVWGTGFGVVTLVEGFAALLVFVATDLLPPRFGVLADLGGPVLDTLAMSYVGMAISVILSVPLGVLAARSTTVGWIVALIARSAIAFVRAVPELVLALFLIAVLGLGPLAGLIALGVGGVGILAKAYADALESVDLRQVEGIKAVGGTWLQILLQGVWPQFQPSFVTWSLYRLDLNIREATVLGLVGAGGLGLALQESLGLLRYQEATAIILVIFGLIIAVETITGTLRRRLL